jgi:hypothetical protein
MSLNRRREQRHKKRLDVLLMVDGEAYEGQTRNLSRGGAFIEVNLQIPVIVEPIVELRFFIPTPAGIVPVACKGRICWLEGVLPNGTGFGIEFEDLDEMQVASLESYFTLDEKVAPAVWDSNKHAIGQALDRWVENGLLSKEGAERYRTRMLG